jgi:hypothetical protein
MEYATREQFGGLASKTSVAGLRVWASKPDGGSKEEWTTHGASGSLRRGEAIGEEAPWPPDQDEERVGPLHPWAKWFGSFVSRGKSGIV